MIGITGSVQGWVWIVPESVRPTSVAVVHYPGGAIAPYRSLDVVLLPSDIAFGSPWMNKVVPSVVGRVVVPGHLTPLLDDREERDRAGDAFFSEELTFDERHAIAEAWNATHIVVEPDDLSSLPWLERDYRVAAVSDAYIVSVIDADLGDR